MLTKICAVRDRAIDAFGQPMFVVAVGQAVRGFRDEVNNKQSAIGMHPEDYDLYEIGEYDDASGMIVPCAPRMVAVGKDLVINS